MLLEYMTNITALTGVETDEARMAMKEVIKFEASMAMVIARCFA